MFRIRPEFNLMLRYGVAHTYICATIVERCVFCLRAKNTGFGAEKEGTLAKSTYFLFNKRRFRYVKNIIQQGCPGAVPKRYQI